VTRAPSIANIKLWSGSIPWPKRAFLIPIPLT
jgi:hypothetical protein